METTPGRYEFAGGYPAHETVRRVYDEADLNRAVQAYRFFSTSGSTASKDPAFDGTWHLNGLRTAG